MADRVVVPEFFHRLGRHIEHDERSRAFPAVEATVAQTVMHLRRCPPYDQGNLGSCTGNAMAGCLMTAPFTTPHELTEQDAVRLYSGATHLDRYPGAYPPDDTGSSGLAVMKAAKREGLIAEYQHVFSFASLTRALTLRPGIMGVNWYSSFDHPRLDGECPLDAYADVRGGHEVEIFGLDMERQRLWCYNSWGQRWGGLKNGTMWFSFETAHRLLSEQGDATFPALPA